MVSSGDLKDLALVPVRGTVYVVKLPFLLVLRILAWFCALIYSIIAKIVSIPVHYVGRVARRVRLTWDWTKSSVRSYLPWQSSSNSGAGRELCPPHHTAQRLPYHDRTDLDHLLYGNNHMHKGKGRGRRNRRMAIISSLIKILMEPCSPVESEEESEMLCKSDDEGEEDKVYRLIRDLVQFSRSGSNPQVPNQITVDRGLDLETLRRHARDKDKLQALITDLDQYVKEMDSGSQREARGVRRRAGVPPAPLLIEDTQNDEDDDMLFTPDNTTVVSAGDTDQYVDASEGEGHASDEESEGDFEDKFDEASSSLRVDSPLTVHRGLSPLVEVSPEVASVGSTESLERSCVDLETELNTAMSRLSTLTGELAAVEESVTESRQTKHTETVVTAPVVSSHSKTLEDEFAGIPKTSPTLGLEAGHNRRNLATARKIRPPSQTKENQQFPDGVRDNDAQLPLAEQRSREFEEDSSEYSSDEEDHVTAGSQQLPSLSDQLKLLTPTSKRHLPTSTQTTSDLYSTVNKKAKTSRARSEGSDGSTSDLNRSRSNSQTNGDESIEQPRSASTPERSLFIHDLTPPWKQIRSRNSSSTDSFTNSPAAQDKHSTPPPPLPSRTLTPPSHSAVPHPQGSRGAGDESPDMYDKLPRILPAPPIPSRAGEEGLYDIIPYQRQQYLHEKLAAGEQSRPTPPVSWTPQLPPRNSMLKRTSSAEVMGSVVKDQQVLLVRHGSERRASNPSIHESREHSLSSSSRRPKSSSLEREQDRKVKHERASSEKHRHHSSSSHSSERSSSSSSKHRSSSEKHHSTEKKTSPWRILASPSSSSRSKTSSSSSSKKPERERERRAEKGEREKRRGEKDRKHSSSSRSRSDSARHESSKSKSRTRREEEIPRNESFSSLRSGVSTLSSDSSGRESLV